MKIRVLLLLLLSSTDAHAWIYYTNGAGDSRVRWSSDGPCTIAFQYHPDGIDSIPGMKEFTVFEDAMDIWNANPCTDVRLVLDGVDDGCEIYAFPGADQNCIVVSYSGWALDHPDQPGAAMLTILSYKPSTGRLEDVDIHVNGDGFDFSLCGDGEGEPWVDYRYAAAHELGHVYGLNHPSPEDCAATDPLPIMCSDGDIYCGDGKPHGPQPDDFEGVCAVYDRALFTCDDSPPEPAPESAPDTITVEPDPELVEVDGSAPKSCCSAGSTPGPGVAFLLLIPLLSVMWKRRALGG